MSKGFNSETTNLYYTGAKPASAGEIRNRLMDAALAIYLVVVLANVASILTLMINPSFLLDFFISH